MSGPSDRRAWWGIALIAGLAFWLAVVLSIIGLGGDGW